MRPLTEEETEIFFKKLGDYIGPNIKFLIDRKEDPWVFRIIESRIYYMSEMMYKQASNIAREHLFHVGTCFGKFTKTMKFRLHITCLDFLAKYAKHKVWLKPNGEQAYLYGNHVLKIILLSVHLAKMSENIPQYDGVVLFSLNETPLGFGVAARSTLSCKDLDPTSIVVFNQADLGEYLRVEDEDK